MGDKLKYLLLLSLLMGFLISVAVNAASGPPGSSSNPVISKSYADKVFQPVYEEVYTVRDKVYSMRDQVKALEAERTALHDEVLRLKQPQFTDVPATHWGFSDIQFMVGKGIIKGMGEGRFAPNNTARRSEVAVMLVKALNLSAEGVQADFRDVPAGHWANSYIAAAQKAGIISGFPGGEFKPNDNVTRAQLAVMLARGYALEKTGQAASFKDVPEGYWANDAVLKLADNGISQGYEDKTFRPAKPVSRAEVAVMLAKTMDPARRNR